MPLLVKVHLSGRKSEVLQCKRLEVQGYLQVAPSNLNLSLSSAERRTLSIEQGSTDLICLIEGELICEGVLESDISQRKINLKPQSVMRVIGDYPLTNTEENGDLTHDARAPQIHIFESRLVS